MNPRKHPRTAPALTALALIIGGIIAAPAPASASPLALDVTDAPFSAVGDGVTNDRPAIQAALDTAGAHVDGGSVTVPAGQNFLSGGLRIPSNVTLVVDGTITQSQDPLDYHADPTTTPPISQPTIGKFTTSGVMYDQAMFHNDPFIMSWGTSNATLTGSGTIQMTWNGSTTNSIYTMAIGFLNTQNFAIENVEILGARSFIVAVYGATGGVVRDLEIDSADVVNTDGVSIINSQDLLVEGNFVDVRDDGLYAVTRIVDPRDYNPNSWWTNRILQPSKNIEFADNYVVSTTRAVAIRGTVHGESDLKPTETTDLWFHDNHLESPNEAVGCWETSQPSPMSRYTFENNTYVSPATYRTGGNGKCLITDFINDFGAPSTADLHNGDFTHEDAWWTEAGDAQVVANDDPSLPAGALAAAASLDGFIGYLPASSIAGSAELAEGLGLGPAKLPSNGTPMPSALATSERFDLSARVQTSGAPLRMFAVDTCSGRILAERDVTATSLTRVTLPFIVVNNACGNVRVGFATTSGASGDWAIVDDVALTNSVIDDTDASAVVYSGNWRLYTNTPTADIDETRSVGFNMGDSATVTFTGKRAWVYGNLGPSLGIITISVDGFVVGTVDTYNATSAQAQLLYDTGEIPWGEHVIVMQITGKNPLAADDRFGFDALLVDRIIDDDDTALVTYSGSWTRYTNTPLLDVKGTRHAGQNAGSTASASFDGSRVWIYGNVGPALGHFEVYLDGATTPVATVDPYAPAVVQGIALWDSGPLAPGPHTISLKLTGTANPASTHTRVGFDAILVGND